MFQPGLVHYGDNSDRELVTRIEVNKGDPERRCEAAWITYSEVFAKGTPYGFHLQRKHLKTIREDACGESPNLFVSRTKTYSFVPDADSQPVRELYPIVGETARLQPDLPPGQKTNANVWNSIATTEPADSGDSRSLQQRPFLHRSSCALRGCCRAGTSKATSWAWCAESINAKAFERSRGRAPFRPAKWDRLKLRTLIPHSCVFMPEAERRSLRARRRASALVRQRRGTIYMETKDDLFSPLRAYIVEVPLEDIIEVNDISMRRKRTRREDVPQNASCGFHRSRLSR